MPLERWSDEIAVIHLADDPQFSDELDQAVEPVKRDRLSLVLDFAGVHFVNSSNISQLLKLRKQAIAGDARLILCALGTQVWGAMLVTGLDKVFEFTDNVMTALATLQMEQR